MNINDLILNSGVELEEIILSLVLSLLIGTVIALVNEKLNKGFSYERSFSLTLVLMTILTTIIMIAIGSSISLSLGLIGALSIVRFRTVLKNTLDMSYLFWAIAIGITLGSKNYLLAIIVTIFIIIVLYIIETFNLLGRYNDDYIIVINSDSGDLKSNEVSDIFLSHGVKGQLKSKTYTDSKSNNVYSVKVGKRSNIEGVIDKFHKMPGVDKVQVFTPNTDLNV